MINVVLTIDYDQEFADLIIGSREVTQQADLDKGLEFISQPFLFAEVKNGIPCRGRGLAGSIHRP